MTFGCHPHQPGYMPGFLSSRNLDNNAVDSGDDP